MSSTSPLNNIIFSQRVIAFASMDLAAPLRLSLVTSSWSEAVLDYGAASLAWKNQVLKPETRSIEEINDDDEEERIQRKRKEKADEEEAQRQQQQNNRRNRFGFGRPGHDEEQRKEEQKREDAERLRNKNKDFFVVREAKAKEFFFKLLSKGRGALAAWALEEVRSCGYWEFIPFQKTEEPQNANHFMFGRRMGDADDEDLEKPPKDFKQALVKLLTRGNWPEGLRVLLLEKEVPKPESFVDMLCKVVTAGHLETLKLLFFDKEIISTIADFKQDEILNNFVEGGYPPPNPLGIAASKRNVPVIKLLLEVGAKVICIAPKPKEKEISPTFPNGQPKTAAQIQTEKRNQANRRRHQQRPVNNAVLSAINADHQLGFVGGFHRRNRFGGGPQVGDKEKETDEHQFKVRDVVELLLEWVREKQGGDEAVEKIVSDGQDSIKNKKMEEEKKKRMKQNGEEEEEQLGIVRRRFGGPSDGGLLFAAIQQGYLETVKLLVERYKVNVNATETSSRERNTPLTHTIQYWTSTADMVKHLEQERERLIQQKQRDGRTSNAFGGRGGGGFGGGFGGSAPRKAVSGFGAFGAAAFSKNDDDDDEELTKPIQVPRNLKHEILIYLLEQAKADLNGYDSINRLQNSSALYAAVKKQSVELVKLFIEKYGGDFFRVADSDTTHRYYRNSKMNDTTIPHSSRAPIHVAASARHHGFYGRFHRQQAASEPKNPVLEIMEYILDKTGNAAANQCDGLGQTPIFYVLAHLNSGGSNVAEQILSLLIERGAILDARRFKDGAQPIHCLNLGDSTYTRPKQRATSIVQLLIENGADVNARTDAPYYDTPLHFHCARGNRQLVEVLVNAGADINAVNGENLTPLAAAIISNNSNGYEQINDEGEYEGNYGGVGCRILNLKTILKLGAKFDPLRDGASGTTAFLAGQEPQSIYDLAQASGRKSVMRLFSKLEDRAKSDYFQMVKMREAQEEEVNGIMEEESREKGGSGVAPTKKQFGFNKKQTAVKGWSK